MKKNAWAILGETFFNQDYQMRIWSAYMYEVKTWCTHCKTYSSFDIPEGTSAEHALGQPCPNCGTRGRLTRV